MSLYLTLPTLTLQADTPYFHSGKLPEIIHCEDPAFNAMLDLTQTKALTIDQDTSIIDAAVEMRLCGVHMLLVVNGHHDKVTGLISSEDILGSKPLKIMQETKTLRENIKVCTIMTPREAIVTIDILHLQIAKVGHIIKTLHQAQQPYAFAVRMDEDLTQTIVGIFSLTNISKQLDKNVTDYDLIAQSLAELQTKL